MDPQRKETDMKVKTPSTTLGKIAISLIVGLVVVGTAFVSNIGNVAAGDVTMTNLFLIFFGAIIALQVVPGLILIGSMVRGIISIGRKESVTEVGGKR